MESIILCCDKKYLPKCVQIQFQKVIVLNDLELRLMWICCSSLKPNIYVVSLTAAVWWHLTRQGFISVIRAFACLNYDYFVHLQLIEYSKDLLFLWLNAFSLLRKSSPAIFWLSRQKLNHNFTPAALASFTDRVSPFNKSLRVIVKRNLIWIVKHLLSLSRASLKNKTKNPLLKAE